jgi:hypothetical protein
VPSRTVRLHSGRHVDATVWVHPSVDVEPGRLWNGFPLMCSTVRHQHAAQLAASMYDEVFARVEVIAYKSAERQPTGSSVGFAFE